MEQKSPIKPEIDHLFSDTEPWESWESKLVSYSIIIGIVSLIILAIIINQFIL